MLDWLLVSLAAALYLGVWLMVLGLCRAAGRRPRRGGYVRLTASNGQRVETTFTTPLTHRVGAYSSSSGAHGDQWVDGVTLHLPRVPSRPGGPGSSTLRLAGRPGQPRRSAGSE